LPAATASSTMTGSSKTPGKHDLIVPSLALLQQWQRSGTLLSFTIVVAGHNDFSLTALQTVTAACGSLIIASALLERRLDAGEAFAASQLDESLQTESWGEDAEQAKRRAALAAKIATAAQS
jgi:chaperone required for assembly of F1-ATPase